MLGGGGGAQFCSYDYALHLLLWVGPEFHVVGNLPITGRKDGLVFTSYVVNNIASVNWVQIFTSLCL